MRQREEGRGERLRISDRACFGSGNLGLTPEHLRFGDQGFAGRIAQIEPMGREILCVVETGIGTLRVLEQGSLADRSPGDKVKIGFTSENSLIFDTAGLKLSAGAHASLPARAIS